MQGGASSTETWGFDSLGVVVRGGGLIKIQRARAKAKSANIKRAVAPRDPCAPNWLSDALLKWWHHA
ncbi:hypothetical protein AWB74_03218 [Caballeronia arvi]|uniref:Uncharacterized protein n=1 Tax=Caballeronia arvi TaxID=1777135 RepID=A0A158J2D2_9BURK|nr:hypothetical protein AWB74_03218 [Caballeronia arvi]